MFSVLHTDGRFVNYRSISKVNTPQNGVVDQALYHAQLTQAQNSSGLGRAEFDRAIKRLTRRVESHVASGTYDLVFKGKWYSTVLEMDLREAFPGRGQMQNVGARATTALLASLDFSQNWAEHLLRAVAALVDQPLGGGLKLGHGPPSPGPSKD
jgi:hypothetical protein